RSACSTPHRRSRWSSSTVCRPLAAPCLISRTCRPVVRSIRVARSGVPNVIVLSLNSKPWRPINGWPAGQGALPMNKLLEVTDLKKIFGGSVRAVDGLSFSLAERETLALVGESGCGKSTVSRLILRLTDATERTIRLEGQDITHTSQRALKDIRREIQFVFQDPFSSLDPRMTAGELVTEPLAVHGIVRGKAERRSTAEGLLKAVGLSAKHVDSWPRQFSGGQRQ